MISSSIPGPTREPLQPCMRPLPPGQSLPLFAAPAAFTALSFHVFRPWLERSGISPLESLLAAITLPTALLFAAALFVFHRLEGWPLTRQAFSERLRFPSLHWRDLVRALVVLVFAILGYGLFTRLGISLIEAGIIPLPGSLPALYDPRTAPTLAMLAQEAGGSLQARWDVVLLYLVMFFFNIAGEELWWRGILLPRQELVHGRHAWLLHGLLWDLFHLFKWWDVIGLLPVCLAVSFSASRFKTNWPGLIAHALFNVAGLLVVAAAAAGMVF
jgi:membrane protease YdiL (CAAX protease family)